jgi:flagellar basal body-associated protein FliL|tara:strand:+ start:48 stop:554 length:507 start_codon:yes stop_codon:yes gene_type:complete
MAEEENLDEQPELPKADTKSPYRYLLLIIIILLVETAGAYFALDWAIPAPEVVEDEPVLLEMDEDIFVPPIFYTDLAEIVFSPLDTQGGQLVSLTIVLEVDRLIVLEEITKKHSRIWDLTLKMLEIMSVLDLRDPGKENVRKELMNAINEDLQNGAVTGVYFTDFIMQ